MKNSAKVEDEIVICTACKGYGYVSQMGDYEYVKPHNVNCSSCNGKGRLIKRTSIDVEYIKLDQPIPRAPNLLDLGAKANEMAQKQPPSSGEGIDLT